MKVYNRTQTIGCVAFDQGDGMQMFPRPGAPTELKGGEMTVFDETNDGGGIVLKIIGSAHQKIQNVGPLADGREYIVIDRGDQYYFIDWTATQAKWAPAASQPQQAANATAFNRWGEIGVALINGLATALAAVGPQFAIPAGMTAGMGSLMLLSLNATQPETTTPPLDLPTISAAVEQIVVDQSQKEQAGLAATSFALAAAWYQWPVQEAKMMRDRPGGVFIPSFKETDIMDRVRSYLDDSHSGFAFYVHHLIYNADVAKWVLPAFAVGLGMYLQFKRLADTMNYLQGTPVTGASVQGLQKKIDECKSGFERARDAFKGYLDAQVAAENLRTLSNGTWSDTDFANTLRQMITQKYTGRNDLQFVQDALDGFDKISASLKDDQTALAGGKDPKHVWNPGWVKNRPQPQPAGNPG